MSLKFHVSIKHKVCIEVFFFNYLPGDAYLGYLKMEKPSAYEGLSVCPDTPAEGCPYNPPRACLNLIEGFWQYLGVTNDSAFMFVHNIK